MSVMEKLIHFIDVLTPYGPHSYFVMFGFLLACGFGFPMPEDVILISGGILSARGICDLYITNVVCFAGVLIGDGTVFLIGSIMGNRVRRTWLFSRILSPERSERVQKVFAKYGDKVVFIARFLPGLRTPIFLTAGIYHVSFWKFFLLDGLAALISVPVWIYVGYIFGDNMELLEKQLRHFQAGMFIAVAAVVAILFAVYFFKKKVVESP